MFWGILILPWQEPPREQAKGQQVSGTDTLLLLLLLLLPPLSSPRRWPPPPPPSTLAPPAGLCIRRFCASAWRLALAAAEELALGRGLGEGATRSGPLVDVSNVPPEYLDEGVRLREERASMGAHAEANFRNDLRPRVSIFLLQLV